MKSSDMACGRWQRGEAVMAGDGAHEARRADSFGDGALACAGAELRAACRFVVPVPLVVVRQRVVTPGLVGGPGLRAGAVSINPWQEAALDSTGDGSRKGRRWTIPQRGRIWSICSLVTPCQPGAWRLSVRRGVSPRTAMPNGVTIVP